jgi:3-hydroxy-3-methylglutaryl CoA synthase/NAD(P)-dependent dehydrogenase (short-subunit alcohol dehydrogenase family)
MIGILSFGAYVPRLRLDRKSIYQNIGWLAPALATVAQGERSVCNWDEDSLTMAVAAARDCLVGVDKEGVDALYLASTTFPYLDRLNAGIAATALNLDAEIRTADFTSSQRAGVTAVIGGLDAARSGSKVLVAAADRRESKAGSFYEMWYGDGAAALLLGEGDVVAEFQGSHSLSYDFVSHYRGAGRRFDYTWEERWVRDQGYSRIIPEAINGLLDKVGLEIAQVRKVIYPCFFQREHAKIARKIGAGADQVADNMHAVCGETGVAHPLLMLVRVLEEVEPGDRLVVAGFGGGCEALCFQVTELIRDLPPRTGVRGSLDQRRDLDNYLKFLKFRDLIETEAGIRAEAPDQTAMTTLWRRRETILGLVGSRCTTCGTPQFPRAEICVNPDCGASHSQESYEFADRPAVVNSFTGDMLAYSVDPPAIYGMVQFEEGGRLMADFTDCRLDDLQVGMPVRMAFRQHYRDEKRGFTGYFWKAVPQRPAGADEETVTSEQEGVVKPIRFDDRVAIVTGAGGGLGRAYALELARLGAKVLVNDLGGARDGTGESTQAADAVVAEIEAMGGTAIANYDSVATVEGGERIVAAALEAFGQVDILINNAGILRDKSFAKMTPETWSAVLDVHLQGAYNVTRPAFQAMREAKYGRIVMTTSAAGLFGNFGQTNYGAAKMGLVGMVNTLKLEGAKYNIQVNAVAPLAATRLTEDVLPTFLLEKLDPAQVIPLVLYLCSERCSANGGVYNAGMRFFGRAAVVSGPGVYLSGQVPTIDEVHRHWAAIESLEGAREYRDAGAALMDLVTGSTA